MPTLVRRMLVSGLRRDWLQRGRRHRTRIEEYCREPVQIRYMTTSPVPWDLREYGSDAGPPWPVSGGRYPFTWRWSGRKCPSTSSCTRLWHGNGVVGVGRGRKGPRAWGFLLTGNPAVAPLYRLEPDTNTDHASMRKQWVGEPVRLIRIGACKPCLTYSLSMRPS